MNLSLKRDIATEQGVFGTLTSEDGSFTCRTLEHAYDSGDGNGSYAPKVLPGVYLCVRGRHQLAHMDKPFTTFEITKVPGHTNILFHKGNYNNDSEGCVLLGTGVYPSENAPTMLTSSSPVFNKFLMLQNGINQFTLTVD